MLNKILLMGRLTRDPELRYTQTEIPVASFSLAVDRNYSKGQEKETDFFDVVAWRIHAEFVSKYFEKGQLVCVEGRLQRRYAPIVELCTRCVTPRKQPNARNDSTNSI